MRLNTGKAQSEEHYHQQSLLMLKREELKRHVASYPTFIVLFQLSFFS
jgi:hypothetical protein